MNTKYKILYVKDGSYIGACMDMEREVNKHLKEGWKLIGGVSITVNDTGNIHFFAQAIYREPVI
jgi:hypothetical protein